MNNFTLFLKAPALTISLTELKIKSLYYVYGMVGDTVHKIEV